MYHRPAGSAIRSEFSNPDRPLLLATFAAPLSGNKGSASMLLGLFDQLRHRNIAFNALVYSYYPKMDKELAAAIPGVEVRPGHPVDLARLVGLLILNRLFGPLLPRSLQRPFRELAECDLVCLVGGTTFEDSMLFKVPWNAMAAWPAMLTRRNYIMLSQTLGPFERRLNRVLATWTLRRAKAVHARGLRSKKNVEDLGLSNVSYCPDLSIGMAVPEMSELPRVRRWIETILRGRQPSSVKIAGVAPNTIVESRTRQIGIDYAAVLGACIGRLNSSGYHVALIPHSYRENASRSHNNDAKLCERVLSRVSDRNSCTYVEEDLSSQELRRLVGEFDLLVASRFHSMVSALVMGTPVITIGWGDQKYIEVLEAFDVPPRLYISCSELSVQAFEERLVWLEQHMAQLSERSKLAPQSNKAQLEKVIDELLNSRNA
jgi:polysaccharide pyruvyl transferase WcaK-like protein